MKKAVASVTVTAWDISNVMNASGESQRIEDSMKKKVYISGKIGEEVLTEATREKFAKAEKMLRSKGYDVFNPTTSGLGRCAEEAANISQEVLLNICSTAGSFKEEAELLKDQKVQFLSNVMLFILDAFKTKWEEIGRAHV